LQLARDVVYTDIIARKGEDTASIETLTKGRPIITQLLKKLCSQDTITTIPLQVHGALFESIGGVSELQNSVAAQIKCSDQLQRFTETLRDYEALIQQYLQRMCNEVLLKGLANPFGFPVVSQHISVCYLSPTSAVDAQVKRFVICVVRNPNLQMLTTLWYWQAHWSIRDRQTETKSSAIPARSSPYFCSPERGGVLTWPAFHAAVNAPLRILTGSLLACSEEARLSVVSCFRDAGR